MTRSILAPIKTSITGKRPNLAIRKKILHDKLFKEETKTVLKYCGVTKESPCLELHFCQEKTVAETGAHTEVPTANHHAVENNLDPQSDAVATVTPASAAVTTTARTPNPAADKNADAVATPGSAADTTTARTPNLATDKKAVGVVQVPEDRLLPLERYEATYWSDSISDSGSDNDNDNTMELELVTEQGKPEPK
jgi:hypothetical protein